MKWFVVLGLAASTGAALLLIFHEVDLDVERHVEIRRGQRECFQFFTNWNNQPTFNYFNRAYPNLVFASSNASADWHFKEGNSEIRAQAFWRAQSEPKAAEFSIRIDYGISIPITGSCQFQALTSQSTRVTCRIFGRLAFYQKAVLPDFRGDDNTVDPLEDSLMNLKTHLEAGR